MDILNNTYFLAVKNKQFLPVALFLLVSAIAGHKKEKESGEYLGDNVPLSLVEKIKNNY